MPPDDILRSSEAKRSVCARNWTLFTILSPVIRASGPRSRVMSGLWTNHSFELILLVNWINQFTQLYWTVWNSSRLEQHRSTSYSIKTPFRPKYQCVWSYNAGFGNSFPKFDMLIRELSTWIKGPNYSCNFIYKGELMKTRLFTLYALDM